MQDILPTFITKYRLARFSKGFYWEHIIVNECQLIRDLCTSFNDPDSNMNVLLLNTMVGAAGLKHLSLRNPSPDALEL